MSYLLCLTIQQRCICYALIRVEQYLLCSVSPWIVHVVFSLVLECICFVQVSVVPYVWSALFCMEYMCYVQLHTGENFFVFSFVLMCICFIPLFIYVQYHAGLYLLCSVSCWSEFSFALQSSYHVFRVLSSIR